MKRLVLIIMIVAIAMFNSYVFAQDTGKTKLITLIGKLADACYTLGDDVCNNPNQCSDYVALTFSSAELNAYPPKFKKALESMCLISCQLGAYKARSTFEEFKHEILNQLQSADKIHPFQ